MDYFGATPVLGLVDYLSLVASLATAFAAVVGGIFGLIEFRRSKRLEFQDKRPFIVPKLIRVDTEPDPKIYLSIRNAGDTPAFNVQLEFDQGQTWHWVSPADYPFLSAQGGITALAPNEEVSYFLGEIRSDNSAFAGILNRDITGRVTIDHPVRRGRRWKDPFRLTLRDGRFQSRSSNQQTNDWG